MNVAKLNKNTKCIFLVEHYIFLKIFKFTFCPEFNDLYRVFHGIRPLKETEALNVLNPTFIICLLKMEGQHV